MKTIAQLEQLEKLQHETSLTGDALQAKWLSTQSSSSPEPAMYDYRGGPVHERFVPKK